MRRLIRKVWKETRLWLLLWLADGRTVMLNATWHPDPTKQMVNGDWHVINNCLIVPAGWSEDDAIAGWKAAHPKALWEVDKEPEPTPEFRFKVYDGGLH